MTKPGTPFVIFIRLGPSQHEHKGIPAALESVACSPVGQLIITEGIAMAFRSTLTASQMADRFTTAKVFMSADSYVLMELGAEYWVQRADPARAWLSQNLE